MVKLPISKQTQTRIRCLMKQAGRILESNITKHQVIKYKTAGEYRRDPQEQSKLDVYIERLFRRELAKLADYPVLGEEEGEKIAVHHHLGYKWILDPIDGTSQYVRGLPLYCISLALVKGSEPIWGIVYAPALNLFFEATMGQSATCNGKKIKLSQVARLDQAYIAISTYRTFARMHQTKLHQKIMDPIHHVRQFGSLALDLCWVAQGKLDARLTVGHQIWDVAAAVLIVRCAGGVITNFQGQPSAIPDRDIIASNKKLNTQLVRLLAQ